MPAHLVALSSAWPETPDYDVVRCLGRGGFGVVYEAFDRQRERAVALKLMAEFTPAALYQFKQEFRTLANVRHPNLVRLHELIVLGPQSAFFTMELVRGRDFRRYCQLTTAAPGNWRDAATVSGLAEVGQGAPQGRTEEVEVASCVANVERLRSALLQLVLGVRALHAAGKLHRDIKPSNVLVTAEGRVVLLDFGLVTELSANDVSEGLVGTPTYMAPEQITGEPLQPASDWYAVGTMLFDVLVGHPPFPGTSLESLHSKLTFDAARPSRLVRGIPQDLDDLCCALLARDPKARPTEQELMRLLGLTPSIRPRPAAAQPVPSSVIGREPQLAALEQAMATVRAGQPTVVRLRGASGMGKSTLVEHFARSLGDGATVLRSRAYEHESIPYKAVDGLIDSLTRHLLTLEQRGVAIPGTEDAGVLAGLFPVLRRVEAISRAPHPPIVDPLRTRELAQTALRQLMFSAAAGRPLVLIIDDAQWGDVDSVALLLGLLPSQPPLRFLLLLSEREGAEGSFIGELSRSWPSSLPLRELTLAPLEDEEIKRLVLRLLGQNGPVAEETADAIAREASGSPFLAEELACSVKDDAGGLPGFGSADPTSTVERLVQGRLSTLDDRARRLLELVALSGRPLRAEIVGAAADATEQLDQALALLGHRRLIRSGKRDKHEVIETSHDRIREAIVSQLSATVQREHHRRLASALEATPELDVEALVHHWLGAGERAQARRAALVAAAQAAEKLAFKTAEAFYRIALDSQPESPQEALLIRQRLAEVLEWDGRGVDAARVCLDAARDATSIQRSKLESAGAIQLLCAGHVADGVSVVRRSLASLGLRAPTSSLGALLWLITYRTWLSLVGQRYADRAPTEATELDCARVDALYSAAFGLVFIDPLLGECMQSQHIALALRKGNPVQQARAVALEASHRARKSGGRAAASAATLFHKAEAMAERSGEPSARAFVRACRGVSQFLSGNWQEAHELLETAYRDVPQHRAGWHTNAWIYNVFSLSNMGRFDEVARRLPALLAGAEHRGDRFMLTGLRVAAGTPLLLAADRPEEARERLVEAEAGWHHPRFLLQHWRAMWWSAEVELYAGRMDAALERVRRDEQRLARSQLFRIQYLRAMTAYLRARLEIAVSSRQPEARSGRALSAIRSLEHERSPWTQVLASMAGASLDVVNGAVESALGRLRFAIPAAEQCHMYAHADASRLRLGALLGGQEGSELSSFATQRLALHGVVQPRRFATLFFPEQW